MMRRVQGYRQRRKASGAGLGGMGISPVTVSEAAKRVGVRQEPRVMRVNENFWTLHDEYDNIVGTLSFDFYDPESRAVFIDHIDIDEARQRRGYGRKLYQAFEREMRDRGIVDVSLNSFEDTVPFWRAMGFDPTGDFERDGQTGRGLVTMEKVLS